MCCHNSTLLSLSVFFLNNKVIKNYIPNYDNYMLPTVLPRQIFAFMKYIFFSMQAIENQGRRVIRYSPKAGSEVVGIWRNMTVQEIANVLNKDLGKL